MTTDPNTGLSIELNGNNNLELAAAFLEYIGAADTEAERVSLDVDTAGTIDLDPAAVGAFFHDSADSADTDQPAADDPRKREVREVDAKVEPEESGSPPGEDTDAADPGGDAAGETEAESFTCDECGEEFPSYQSLGGHVTQTHSEDGDDMQSPDESAQAEEARPVTHRADPDEVTDGPTSTRDYVRDLTPGNTLYKVALALAAQPHEEPYTSDKVHTLVDSTSWDTPASTSISNALRDLAKNGALDRSRADATQHYEYERTSAGTHAFGLLEKHAQQDSELETYEQAIADGGDGETAEAAEASEPETDSEREEWAEAEATAVAGGEEEPTTDASDEAASSPEEAGEDDGTADESEEEAGLSALFDDGGDESDGDFELYGGGGDDIEADD